MHHTCRSAHIVCSALGGRFSLLDLHPISKKRLDKKRHPSQETERGMDENGDQSHRLLIKHFVMYLRYQSCRVG